MARDRPREEDIMDTITPEEIQTVETAALALSARAHLVDLACAGLCRMAGEVGGQVAYHDVEPLHTLAKEVTALADDLETEIVGLRAKITPPRVRVGG
jgi:hypothetical protein